jgi:hypothetical protein
MYGTIIGSVDRQITPCKPVAKKAQTPCNEGAKIKKEKGKGKVREARTAPNAFAAWCA